MIFCEDLFKYKFWPKTPGFEELKEGVSIAHIAADLHVSKHDISDLKQAATGLPDNTMPTRKAGTKKWTTEGTNAVWHRDVILNPSINHASLKKKQPMLLQGISIRAERPEYAIMLCS